MKLKRFLAMVLCVAMVLSTMSLSVFAEDPALPNAEVIELGEITINEYSVYNGSLTEGGEPIDLQVAMQFIAKDTPQEAAANYYGNYTTDFFITMNGIENGSFIADGCYLAGNYGTFGWIQVPLDGFEVENGVTYPVITSVGFDFKYTDICDQVKDFKCGIYLSEDVIKANPDLEVNLALGLSETFDDAKNAEFIAVDDYSYPAKYFGAVAEINGTTYTDIHEAVDASADGDEVILLKDIEISKQITIKNKITFNGNGHVITPAADFAADGHNAALVVDAQKEEISTRAATQYTVKSLTLKGFDGLTRVVRANFGDINIEGCTFEGNKVSEGVITSAYADLTVSDCIFDTNKSDFSIINVGSDVDNGTDAVASITGNTLVNNEAAVSGIYLASSANVTDNYFNENIHTGDNANGAAILAGPYTGQTQYTININENAFENAMTKNGVAVPAVYAEDWSAAYGTETSFNLSSNYWDGNKPAKGVAYSTNAANADITLDNYYTKYDNGTLDDLVETFVAKIGNDGYKTIAAALSAAQSSGMTDVTITLVGNPTKNEAKAADDYFNLYTQREFDSITITQEDVSTPYYIAGIYTGSRTNNGTFTFDGVNIVVIDQYIFEGNVKLTNNSAIKSVTEANCFIYNGKTEIEPGSSLQGIIENLRSGKLVIDGGRTDGTYNDTPDMKDAILAVQWSGDSLTLKNGAFLKVNSANEIGRLSVNSGTSLNVYDSKVETVQYINLAANGKLNMDTGSIIKTKEITGDGEIIIDASDFDGEETQLITANMSNFNGTISVVGKDGASYKITNSGVVLYASAAAKIGDVYYTSIEEAFKAATSGCTIDILFDVTFDGAWDCRYNGAKFTVPVTINGNGNTLTYTGTIQDNNWNAVLRFEDKATVKNITIDVSGASTVQRAISTKLDITADNVTIIGNTKYGIIFGEGAGAALADVEVNITNSNFIGQSKGVSDNANGQDAKNVTITGCEFENSNVFVSASENVVFNDNTVENGYVNITSYSTVNELSVVATGNTLDNIDGYPNQILAAEINADPEFVTPAAMVGNTYYLYVEDAIKAAADGDTLKLIASCSLPSTEAFALNNVDIIAADGVVLTLTSGSQLEVNGGSITGATIDGAGTIYFGNTVNFYGDNSVTCGVNGTPFELIVNKEATLLITRFVLGYDRSITVYGTIEDAHTFDPTGKTPSLKFNSSSGVSVGGTNTGKLTAKDAYIELGNSSWKDSYATHDWSFTNCYVSAVSFGNNNLPKSDSSTWDVTFDNSVLAARNYIKTGKNVTYNFNNGSVATTGSLRNDGVINIDKTSSVATTAQQNNKVGALDEHGGNNGTINLYGNLTIGSTSKTQFEHLGGKLNIYDGTLNLANNTLTLDAASALTSTGNIRGNITVADGATTEITGGTYTVDVNEWCSDGYKTTKQESTGLYFVFPEFVVEPLADVETAKAGDTITVKVKVTEGGKYTNASWELKYDPSYVTYTGTEEAKNYKISGSKYDGNTDDGNDEFDANTELGVYTFTVNNDVHQGTAVFEIVSAEVHNYKMAIEFDGVAAATRKDTVNIELIDGEGTIVDKELPYNGSQQRGNEVTGAPQGARITYSETTDFSEGTHIPPAFVNAGTHTYYAKIEMDGHADKVVEGKLTITPIAVTPSIEWSVAPESNRVGYTPIIKDVLDDTYKNGTIAIYNGQELIKQLNASDFEYNGHGKAIYTGGELTISGVTSGELVLTVVYTAGTDDNYVTSTKDAKVDVDKSTIDDTMETALENAITGTGDIVYDGQTHYVSYDAAALPAGWEAEVDTHNGVRVVGDVNVVDVTFKDTTGKYNDYVATVIIKTVRREVTISVKNVTKKNGQPDSEVLPGSYIASPSVIGNDLGEIKIVRAENANGEIEGEYAITATYTPNNNYIVNVIDGKLTITDAVYVIEVVDNSKNNNAGTDVEADYTVGTRMILVHTDADYAFFTYNGTRMYDVTDAGYTYFEHDYDNNNHAEGKKYQHVYAIIVEAEYGYDATELCEAMYAAGVSYAGKDADASYAPVKVTYDADINDKDALHTNDYSTVKGVYNTIYDLDQTAILKADYNKNKLVNTADAQLVKNEVIK